MKLFELRGSALDYFQQMFPNMPRYVVQDFVYKNYRNNPEEAKHLLDEFGDMRWKQEAINVSIDAFDPETRRRIEARAGGTVNPFQVPKDEERHATQQKLLAAGPSQEPIIVVETPRGYELIEGWHRTIQSLQMWPEGYKQNAWVGYK